MSLYSMRSFILSQCSEFKQPLAFHTMHNGVWCSNSLLHTRTRAHILETS